MSQTKKFCFGFGMFMAGAILGTILHVALNNPVGAEPNLRLQKGFDDGFEIVGKQGISGYHLEYLFKLKDKETGRILYANSAGGLILVD